MVRLRNTVTGAIVSVSDEKAGRMGAHWEPVEKPSEVKPARKPRSKKKD